MNFLEAIHGPGYIIRFIIVTMPCRCRAMIVATDLAQGRGFESHWAVKFERMLNIEIN
jgi:hypothetical protein